MHGSIGVETTELDSCSSGDNPICSLSQMKMFSDCIAMDWTSEGKDRTGQWDGMGSLHNGLCMQIFLCMSAIVMLESRLKWTDIDIQHQHEI